MKITTTCPHTLELTQAEGNELRNALLAAIEDIDVRHGIDTIDQNRRMRQLVTELEVAL